jgi:Polyketide cyclase / dehydrase and lipid transport
LIDKTYSLDLSQDPQVVFDYVTDPWKIQEWAPYIQSVKVDPPGPLKPGSVIIQTVRNRDAVWKITEFEPPTKCVYEADYWYATAKVAYLVTPTQSGCRFTIREQGRRSGLMRWLGPILSLIDAYYRRRQMDQIQQGLEPYR